MADLEIGLRDSPATLGLFLNLVGEDASTELPQQSPRIEFDWNGTDTALVTYTKTVVVDAGKARQYLADATSPTGLLP